MAEMKQVILLRKDLKLPLGKACVQVAHASVACFEKTNIFKRTKWLNTGMKKVVLAVNNLDELKEYEKKAKSAKLICCMITDAGKTVVEPGTITCLGIGPDDEEKIDTVTGNLKII